MYKNSNQGSHENHVTHKAILSIIDHVSDVNDKGTGKQSIAGNAKDALNGQRNKVISGIPTAEGTNIESPSHDHNTIVLQYNPKSIQISASAADTRGDAAVGSGDTQAITAGCSITMSIELLFYCWEEKDDSVRKQMDVLFGLMSKRQNRNVRFSWAAMAIEGEVTSFSSSYDMFDGKGKPISGKVNMSIQSKEEIEDKAYDKLAKERR